MNQERNIYKAAVRGLMPDYDRVRMRAKLVPRAGRTGVPRWLVPCLGAACAIVVVCAAMPPVRATLADIFSDTVDYVGTPKEMRPAIANVDVQQVSPESPHEWQMRIFEGADSAWKDKISSFRVDEALYDGRELTLKYSVSAPDSGLVYGDDLLPGPEGAEATSGVPCVVNGIVVEHPEQIADIERVSLDDLDNMEEWHVAFPDDVHVDLYTTSEFDNGSLTLTSVFDVGEVSPDDGLALLVSCDYGSRSSDGMVHFDKQGYLQVPLHLDLRQPSVRRAESQTFMVHGVPVEATEAVQRSTGLQTDFRLPFSSWAESLDFQVYVDNTLVTPSSGELRGSCLERLESDGKGMMCGEIRVPFAGQDVSSVRLVGLNCDDGTIYEEDAMVLMFE